MGLALKAFFLDRDGVLNDNRKPVNKPRQLKLLPGAAEAVRLMNEAGYGVFVVTNQGGVGLGYMSAEDLDEVHRALERLVGEKGGRFTEVCACIHKPAEGCACRKPEPGMLTGLIDRYGIEPESSYMVGDRDIDIEAGRKAGVRTVLIGRERSKAAADYGFASLLEAAQALLQSSD